VTFPRALVNKASILFQSKKAICWYFRYANPAINSPEITTISLTTFLMAYPKSSPPKNPPPTVAEIEAMISEFKQYHLEI
jgi:hypothetical protein